MADREQIEKMARDMCGFCIVDKRCALKCCAPCSDVASCDCSYKENAKMLIDAGYGDISEYKAEIERLEQQNAIQCDAWQKLSDENERLVTENNSNLRYNSVLRKENKKLKEEIKQAKIDILNKVKSLAIYDDNYLDGYVFIDDINKLIEEVENDNSKSN